MKTINFYCTFYCTFLLIFLLLAGSSSIHAQSYCSSMSFNAGYGYISNVTAGTLNNSSNYGQTGGPGSTVGKYSDYTTLVAAPVFYQSTAVSFSVSTGGSPVVNSTTIWIDFNHDGTFENSDERVFQSAVPTPINGTVTGSFTIPATALTGTTRMRVVNNAGQTPVASACDTYNAGETEDYIVDIQPMPACSGDPIQTKTIATQLPVCPEARYTFSLSPAIYTTGNTYQWYNNNGPIAGATSETYTATITSQDSFYCDVTCPDGAKTTRSIPVPVTICYCTSAAEPSEALEILNVTAGTLNNSTTLFQPGGPASVPGSYSDFTPLVAAPVFNQLATIPFSVSVGGFGYYSYNAIWIDYNQNGTFESPGEYIYLETGFGAFTATGSFTIPITALTGITRMRVITSERPLSSACQNYERGETEDYLINIVPPPACSGSPVQTKTIATQNPVCPVVSLTFSLSPDVITSNNTYQWYNDAGPIAGATSDTYTATITGADNYYCAITCPTGESTTRSTPFAVQGAYLYCPCASISDNANSADIANVTVGDLNNSSTCGSTGGPGSILSRYSDYSSLVAAPNLTAANTIPVSIGITSCGGFNTSQTSVWIDFNHNGSFDAPEERVYLSAKYVLPEYTLTGSITIPETALTGLTRMRVIHGAGDVAESACGAYISGETEDYFVNILAPTCSGTPTPGSTAADQFIVCTNAKVDLYLTSPPTITDGITYKWFKDDVLIEGATDATYSTVVTATAIFHCEVTCTNSGLTASAEPVTIYVNPVFLPTAATTNTQDVAATPLVANNCEYIAKVVPTEGFTEVTVKSWLETNPSFGYVPRHYEITPSTNANTATGTVTLYFLQADFDAYNATISSGLLPTGPNDDSGIANFQIVKFSGTSETGLNYPGPPAYIPGESNSWNSGNYTFVWNSSSSIWEVTFPVSGFSGFIGKSIGQALPVTLISFTGKAVEKSNELTWKTSSEVDFSHFEIQRSIDAKTFEKIGEQASDDSRIYSFTDHNSPRGKAYYRLKMIDLDTRYSFSKMIAIGGDTENSVVGNVYPNPSTSKAYIEINTTEKGTWNITHYDVTGRLLSRKRKILQAGSNIISIDKLSPGLNILKFDNGSLFETRKLIKE